MSDGPYEFSWEEAVQWLKNQPGKQNLVIECFYDDPPIESAQRYYESSEWRAVKKLIGSRPKGKVLDIGAGRGISSYSFVRDGWHVTALEPNPGNVVGTGAIKQLGLPDSRLQIVENIAEKLPFPNESFDLVYGRAVLHHANDLGKFCKEVARVVKQSGQFLFTREHVLTTRDDLQNFLKTHPLHPLYGGEYAYTVLEYKRGFEEAGLRCRNVMAPYNSDINLFPATQRDHCCMIRGKTGIPLPDWFIKAFVFPLMNKRNSKPGRLYSFYGDR
jgi:SAM-dependent methyltransferase